MQPLKPGDEIRVIAPSFSGSTRKYQRHSERARARLESLGYVVTFGKHLTSQDMLGTARATDRAEDFNAAYADTHVKAVLALTGGWSANEILPLIDWGLVSANPKPMIGYSDITALINAMYAKTGNVGYLGPNFLTLSRMTSWEYTLDNFQAVLKQQYPRPLERSNQWADKPSERRRTKPWKVLQPGRGQGVLIGGNLGTFYLLQGTEYQPAFDEPFILVAEDDDESGKYAPREFSRRLESLLQLPNARDNIRGMVIGRFQTASKMTDRTLMSLVRSKQLGDIPVVSGVDFGHTAPTLTLPIGRKARLSTEPRISFVLD